MKQQFGILTGLMAAALVAGTAAPAQAAGEKIGYVDLARVFDEYQKTKEFDKQLESKGSGKQNEREKMVNEIKKLRDEAELLSASAKEDKQAVIDEKIRTLQEFDRSTRSTLGKERDTMVRDILKEIELVVQDFGKSQGYNFIFYDRALAYKGESHNLTSQVIKVLNDAYTKKR